MEVISKYKRKLAGLEGFKSVLVTIAILVLGYAKDFISNGDYFSALLCVIFALIVMAVAFYLNAKMYLKLVKEVIVELKMKKEVR